MIKVTNVSKKFVIPHEKKTTIRENLFSFLKLKRNTYETFYALNEINFDIEKGDFYGIIGRNGSGKSTLLKILANIYIPDKGTIEVNGNISAFLELGVGFNMELTGRENVYLNGILLGLSKSEINSKIENIVKFAELERFMDQKLKNYSSGMQVRLAFSVAIQATKDILLIDEALAVGDENFKNKCYEVFDNFKKEGKTIVFVTHDMGAIKKFCNKTMLLDQGQIVEIGEPEKIIQRYIS